MPQILNRSLKDPNPIAKHNRKLKTNLGRPSDQIKIHKSTYQNYLNNELKIPTSLVEKLLNLYDKLGPNKDTIHDEFKLPIPIYHKKFLSFLSNL